VSKFFPRLLLRDSQVNIIRIRYLKPLCHLVIFATLFYIGVCFDRVNNYKVEIPVFLFCGASNFVSIILDCYNINVFITSAIRLVERYYGMPLLTIFAALVVFSHSVFSSAKSEGEQKLYRGLKRKDIVKAHSPDTTNVVVGLVSILAMLVCLVYELYITFIFFFLVNFALLIRDYIWLGRISSERSMRNGIDVMFKRQRKQIHIAKRAAKHPRFFLGLFRETGEPALNKSDKPISFNNLLNHYSFYWKREQLNAFLFLCLSYYEVFWETGESNREQMLRFLDTYQRLRERYGFFIMDFNRKTWRYLFRWVRILKDELPENLYSSVEHKNIAEELFEDYRKLSLGKPFCPKRKIIREMQFY